MKPNTADLEYKVGFFVAIGVGLIMFAIVMLGGANTLISNHETYHLKIKNTEGLIVGSKVHLNGLKVGVIEDMSYGTEDFMIHVDLDIDVDYLPLLRKNATAEIATQGVLGDKYVEISGGTAEFEQLPPGSEIDVKSAGSISQFLSSGGTLMESLNKIAGSLERILASFEKENRQDMFFEELAHTARNLSRITKKLDKRLEDFPIDKAVQNLNGILEKINRGKGTVGALVNDPALYDDIKSLIGGANRNRILRNLVRKAVRDGETPTKDPQ